MTSQRGRCCSPRPGSGGLMLSIVVGLIGFVNVCSAGETLDRGDGGHFRYATMFWKKTDDAMSNTVQFTVESAWRYSYGRQHFVPQVSSTGDTVVKINGAATPMITFGDGSAPHYLEAGKITAYSESEDWFLVEEMFTHTFATPNNRGTPWEVEFSGCCRVSGIVNGGDTAWHMKLEVDLLASLESIRVVSLPVIFISAGTPGPHFKLATAGADPTTEEVVWAMGGEEGGALTVDAAGKVTFSGGAPSAPYALYHMLAYAGTTARKPVPLDIIVNVSQAAVPRPVFHSAVQQFSHPFSAPLDLADVDMFRVHAYPGFPLKVQFQGYQDGGSPSYIGYTVARLPEGATVSTVSGSGTSMSDPATMTLMFTACPEQLGSVPVCADVTDSEGVAATQHCLEVEVTPDPPPMLAISLNDGDSCVWNCGGAGSSRDGAELYVGRSYTLHLTATDHNPEDTLDIAPEKCAQVPRSREFAAPCDALPWGSELGEAEEERGASLVVSRALKLEPGYSHGGYSMQHCFMATDGCGVVRGEPAACMGGGQCPGVQESAVQCVVLHVRRCQFVVQAGHTLAQIAAMYRTDWLQLWSHNQHLDTPDASLQPGSVLQIGRVYDVQPHDTPAAVAARFGMDEELFLELNADFGVHGWQGPSCRSIDECRTLAGNLTGVYQWCLLPSSCKGDSGSIYEGHTAGGVPESGQMHNA